ncbi:hypothetical protein BHE74_00041685 [Ensete ventricosum]|nr:hypothetical protein GW17_00026568 [Ensete ventricosum]RWW51927.1 hypothetical protein BHE74_00041685 [Ensete ventricosum]RZS14703.1 hypothetical protein BHM03_00046442 [Ensete ventricosum]
MDARLMGLDGPLMSTLHHLVDLPDEVEKALSAPTRTYVRDARAMAKTPADVKELPGFYVFVVDMPELKPNEIKVQVEDDSVLVVSGERRRKEEEEEEKEEVKYLRMERRMGKFMRRFSLPENANVDVVSATYKDGVLTITVEKLPPPEPKKTKTIEVKVA